MADFLFRCHRDYDGALHKVATARPSEGDISPSDQSVGVGTLDMRSDLFHGPRAGRSVSAENVDIITNQTDGADSGAIPAPASALDLNQNQISPFFVRELGLFRVIGAHDH